MYPKCGTHSSRKNLPSKPPSTSDTYSLLLVPDPSVFSGLYGKPMKKRQKRFKHIYISMYIYIYIYMYIVLVIQCYIYIYIHVVFGFPKHSHETVGISNVKHPCYHVSAFFSEFVPNFSWFIPLDPREDL